MNNDIVITGMGVVSPIGASVEDFWQANLIGKSGLRTEQRMDLSDLPCGWVSAVLSDNIRESVQARYGHPGRSWVDTIMHAAVDEALDDAQFQGHLERAAGLVWSRVWPGPSGSFPEDYPAYLKDMAACHRAVGADLEGMAVYLRERPLGPEYVDQSKFPGEISARIGQPLISARVEATCSGGLRGIVEGARLLQSGKVDFAIVAASVSRNTPYVLSQYAQLMALSRWEGAPEQASMPFDRRRSGMVIAEMAGAIVLETAAHAARRGIRRMHAVIGGWGLAVDTVHVTAPRVEMIEYVVRTALNQSKITVNDIDVISAHGTSTRLNDVTEARALHQVFGERMQSIDVSAIKSLTGHGSAASGIVESIASALMMCRGVVPPVVTCTDPDPECAIRTSLTPVTRPVGAVLKNSFGFGGQYASMVFTRPSNPR